MKNNKGISLISLIITIIVIIILAAITVYYGLNKNIQKATETQVVYEVHSLLDAVNSRTLMHKINSQYYTYVGTTDFGSYDVGPEGNKTTYEASEGWYLVKTKDEFAELGLENVTGEYLVNYEKGLAVSINGVQYENRVYYSLNELKQEVGGGSTVISNAEYDQAKQVNKPVLSTGMVPVKLSGGKWVVTSTDDDGWYDYSSNEMAWANVMLMDELTVEGYTNEQVKDTPISELVGKEVLTEGSSYVWIPRYTATSVGGTGSKIIFSNLIDDTHEKNGESYSLPDSFRYGEGSDTIELTGIWVSKYEAGFDR